MSPIKFKIEKKLKGALGRAGKLSTPNGDILTPAFVTVGTKATVKSLSPEQVANLGAQVILANTYHLYLQPGDKIIKKAGGLCKFINWKGPTMTDSGGFQVFSLGEAMGSSVSKIASGKQSVTELPINKRKEKLAKIDENGVKFTSPIDGSSHYFTPEKSIEIQHNIGADMIFAFDECTSSQASYEYQIKAMERTHRWAKRCIDYHKKSKNREKQALFGIVQGGKFSNLRKKSAQIIASMPFDGFGIGGSFIKEDIDASVYLVNKILPEDKPRHLLGIGEPIDLFGGVEKGVDLFDCVAPTRIARNGTLYTKKGKINIFNAKYKQDFKPIEKDCACYTCKNYTKAYIAHLFRAKEIFAATLASIHNLYFIVNLVSQIRESILNNNFYEFKKDFLKHYL
ncbi:MAG: tRNA guanosine(34) transglycosylase Tgt [Patescibacteria group bacterium]